MPSRPSIMQPALFSSPQRSWLIFSPSSVRQLRTPVCLLSQHRPQTEKEAAMQSMDLEEIKAALWEQAYHPCARVRWGMAQVMAVRKSRGQQLVQLRGRGRRHTVEAVTIE